MNTSIPYALDRRRLLLGSLALSSFGLPSSVGAAAPAAPSGLEPLKPKRGGTLTLLLPNEPANLVGTSPGSEFVTAKANEGLLSYDSDLNPRPQLATAWSISPDGTRYTFTLREGVRWHDGKDFTSADVATSIKILKQWHARGRTTFAKVTAIETPDPHTAVIVLSKPAPYLLYALAAVESPIVAAHLYAEHDDPALNPAARAPVGTGPFRFRQWDKGSQVVYDRNPDYWDQPKPYIDQLVLRIIPEAGARSAAFETGELLLGSDPVPLSDIDRLRSAAHLGFTTEGYTYSIDPIQIEFNLDNPYFKHLKVRQAVAHAINRQVILDRVWYGYGLISPSAISPVLKRFYAGDVETYPFDLAKANALLDEAGFKRGPDGVRFSVFHDYNPWTPPFLQQGQYIRQALKKVGIDVTVRSQDFATFVKRIYTDHDFDFNSNALSNVFDPTVGVQRVYWSKSIRKGVPFSNASHYSNPKVDELLEAAAVEPDEAKRIAYFNEFQKIVANDVPLIDLITLKHVTIFNKKVHNHTTGADGLDGNLADVFLDDATG